MIGCISEFPDSLTSFTLENDMSNEAKSVISPVVFFVVIFFSVFGSMLLTIGGIQMFKCLMYPEDLTRNAVLAVYFISCALSALLYASRLSAMNLDPKEYYVPVSRSGDYPHDSNIPCFLSSMFVVIACATVSYFPSNDISPSIITLLPMILIWNIFCAKVTNYYKKFYV